MTTAKRHRLPCTVLGNPAPTADAGPDQSVRGAAIVALDGTASNDTDGHITGYAWQQIGGTPVTLSGADTARPTFTAPRLPEAQVLSFELTVTDNLGAQATAAVHITVLGTNPQAPMRVPIKRCRVAAQLGSMPRARRIPRGASSLTPGCRRAVRP